MTLPRLLAVAAMLLGLLALAAQAVRAGGGDLPDPDLAAVTRLIQRVGPGNSYAGSLPARRRECIETATPYLTSGLPDRMAWGERLLIECYVAMLIKMAAVYYDSESFEPKTFTAIVDGTEDDTYLLFHGIYNENPACRPWCGTMFHVMPGSAVEDAFRNAVLAMAWAQLNGGKAREDWDARWKHAELD